MPRLGAQVPQRGNWLMRIIGRAIFVVLGWRFAGVVPNLPKFVVIGAPHTSNWDFPLAVVAMWAVGIDITVMGKHTLFRKPYGWFFHWLGLMPINRTAAHGVVEQSVAEFGRRKQLVLGLAPEGTRSKVQRWKTGFYHIAAAAEVPIVAVALDFGCKTIRIHEPLWPSGDVEADIGRLKALFAEAVGKNPELGIVGE